MNSKVLKIGIPGAAGRMGATLIDIIASDNRVELIAATEVSGHPSIGSDAGSVAGLKPLGLVIQGSADEMFEAADAVIDFTLPETTENHLRLAEKHKTILIIGTTGVDETKEPLFESSAKTIPIVRAPNMSLSVNLLFAITEQVARTLDANYDIEIIEMHHRYKVDAPSGTAIGLGKAAARGRGSILEEISVKARDGITGERERGTIGFSSLRGGDVVGDHSVIFAADGERLELSHKSASRHTYARGAVTAALWANDQSAGLYTMQDVLGFKQDN